MSKRVFVAFSILFVIGVLFSFSLPASADSSDQKQNVSVYNFVCTSPGSKINTKRGHVRSTYYYDFSNGLKVEAIDEGGKGKQEYKTYISQFFISEDGKIRFYYYDGSISDGYDIVEDCKLCHFSGEGVKTGEKNLSSIDIRNIDGNGEISFLKKCGFYKEYTNPDDLWRDKPYRPPFNETAVIKIEKQFVDIPENNDSAEKESEIIQVEITVGSDDMVDNTPSASSEVSTENEITSVESQLVWISSSSRRYHFNSSCSHIKDAVQVSIEDAVSMGYSPCAKCAQ